MPIFLFSFLYHNDVVMLLLLLFCQITSKSVTVNPIQSLSINIPHTVMCTFEMDIWHTYEVQPSAFQFSDCHPNCCHSLHQVTLTESTVILTT